MKTRMKAISSHPFPCLSFPFSLSYSWVSSPKDVSFLYRPPSQHQQIHPKRKIARNIFSRWGNNISIGWPSLCLRLSVSRKKNHQRIMTVMRNGSQQGQIGHPHTCTLKPPSQIFKLITLYSMKGCGYNPSWMEFSVASPVGVQNNARTHRRHDLPLSSPFLVDSFSQRLCWMDRY